MLKKLVSDSQKSGLSRRLFLRNGIYAAMLPAASAFGETNWIAHDPALNLESEIRRLQKRLQGGAFSPSDAGYDSARSAWNLGVDQHPSVVVSASSENDIVAAVEFAREHSLGIAVQATGHGVTIPADGACS